MENELALRRESIPNEHEIMVYHTMAENAVASKMYKGIGEKSAVMMIMLSARELGIPCMQALNGGLNIINGKVEISARMMSALIRKAGHQLKIIDSSATSCMIEGFRHDTREIQKASFSITEAQQAGLIKVGGGWAKWPKDMLFARALSRLARQLFSDVIGIGYVEGEISQINEKPPEIEEEDKVISISSIEVNDEDEIKAAMEGYYWIFDLEDRDLALKYLNVVQKHFSWTLIYAIAELMKDQKALLEKFNKWKEKQ